MTKEKAMQIVKEEGEEEIYTSRSSLNYFPKGTKENSSKTSRDIIIRFGRVVIVISIFRKEEGK